MTADFVTFDAQRNVTEINGYPLKKPCPYKYEGRQMTLGPLQAEGDSEETAFQNIGRQLYAEIQRFFGIPPQEGVFLMAAHERSEHDSARVFKLIEFIDFYEYRRRNPPDENVLGKITSRIQLASA